MISFVVNGVSFHREYKKASEKCEKTFKAV